MIQVKILSTDGPEPVSKNLVKSYLRVYNTGDDQFIEDFLIPAARAHIEQRTGISLVEKTINVVSTNSNANYMLPQWPVDEVLSITDGIEEENGYLNNAKGSDFEITYKTDAYIEADTKQAILNLCSHWFVNRDMTEAPKAVNDIIMSKTRKLWFA